jgi:hypothetical protein
VTAAGTESISLLSALVIPAPRALDHPHSDLIVSMEDFTEDAFANRESPVPVIAFGDGSSMDGPDDADNGTLSSDRKRGGLFTKHALNLKDSFTKGHKRSDSGRSFNMQDRLLERYMATILENGEAY